MGKLSEMNCLKSAGDVLTVPEGVIVGVLGADRGRAGNQALEEACVVDASQDAAALRTQPRAFAHCGEGNAHRQRERQVGQIIQNGIG